MTISPMRETLRSSASRRPMRWASASRVTQAGGRGERDAVSRLGGCDRQCGSQMSLASAWRTHQYDIAGFGKPAAGFQAGDLGAIDVGLGREVEVGDRLDRRQSRIAMR
jgi:hypothetical protein